MHIMLKVRLEYYIVSIWVVYMIYLVLFNNLLLFPKDSLELLVPAILQLVIAILFNRLFKVKYVGTFNLTTLICCVLVILWHFNLDHGISRKPVVMIFLVLPIFSTVVAYFMTKIVRTVPTPVFKHFGVSLLLTFLNFIVAVFTFYIFHYLI